MVKASIRRCQIPYGSNHGPNRSMKDHQTRRLGATTRLAPAVGTIATARAPNPAAWLIRCLLRRPSVRRRLRVTGRPRRVSTWAERYCQGERGGYEFRHPLQSSVAGPRWLVLLGRPSARVVGLPCEPFEAASELSEAAWLARDGRVVSAS